MLRGPTMPSHSPVGIVQTIANAQLQRRAPARRSERAERPLHRVGRRFNVFFIVSPHFSHLYVNTVSLRWFSSKPIRRIGDPHFVHFSIFIVESHARARPRGSATSPDEPTVERHN